MGTLKNSFGKFLYGSLFMGVLPYCLIAWAKSTNNIIQLRVPDFPVAGLVLFISGITICLWGMASLVLYGKGLPMNAFPPKFYVSTGIYSLLNHPIYFGSGMIAFGLSLFLKSPSGFWLVSPVFCTAMIAFVTGFENEKIKSTEGYFVNKLFFSLPEKNTDIPSLADRLNVFVLALIPWILLYEMFIFIGIPKDALFTNFDFEKLLPVIEFSEFFYVLLYFQVIIIPFLLRSKSQVRSLILDTWWAMFPGFFIYLAFPFVVHQREFIPANFLGRLIYLERNWDGVSAALPAFHVVWAFLMAKYFSARFGLKRYWQMLAILISLSCIGNGSHSILDVTGGFVVYLMVNNRHEIWKTIRQIAERIANSWKEWHWGQVRLINHGLYAGSAGFVGMLVVGCCLGEAHSIAGFFVGVAGIIGAVLWAQVIEGSPRLLRPYGYYGSVIGIIAGSAIFSMVYEINFMYMLASFALAAPWFQMLGRLRCLVQGCCHGRPCNPDLGIKFTNSQSRVLKIAELKGIPIHPTQLYSIFSNLLIALLLVRFLSLEMPVSFIAGIYLILNGLARFVEESFRGEPQTAYWQGLRLYQWIAILSVIAGVFITSIPGGLSLTVTYSSSALMMACITGLIATISYGLDFPMSNKRFARLTS